MNRTSNIYRDRTLGMPRRQRRFRVRRRIAFLIVTFCLMSCAREPVVVVVNGSGTTLSDVRVEFAGGQAVIGELPQGARRTITVSPHGESHLELRFRGPDGTYHDRNIDTYFEAGYHGTVKLTVHPDLRVTREGTFSP
jgi:hypothetical protein